MSDAPGGDVSPGPTAVPQVAPVASTSAYPQERHEQLGLSDGHWVTPRAELGSFDVRVEPFPRVADTSNPSPTQVGPTHAGDASTPQPNGDATQTTPDAPRRNVSPGLAPVPQVPPAASVATANSSTVTTDGVPRFLLPDVRVTVGPPLVAPHELVDAILRLASSDPLAYETIVGITQTFTAMAPVTPGTSNLLSILSSTQSVMDQPHVGTTISSHSTVSSPAAPESASRIDVVQGDVAADATAPGPVPLNGVASEAKRAAQYNRWVDSEGRPIAGPSRLG
ncbi:uncharacterized protein C8Q71DRAFT_748773 [Rhodofomes roseus]|uniref:Uncharacterized protein n=1 Tax=Rhodofomes roseus TaxID=34475 RepID=A0ABQ8KN84_9APHY|nr:uncharacterized protein C8Q71DRAFT_748773 [Rhodofomes roseus]KAH9839271.1 hypothetical protein C8Q71DRAFT_748773 [Rhodofomes roseus]